MCCRDFALCNYAAVFIIIQSIIHLTICGWIVGVMNCKYFIEDTEVIRYFWWMTYAYIHTCQGYPHMQYQFDPLVYKHPREFLSEKTVRDAFVFPYSSNAKHKTYQIISPYLTLDPLWLITSGLLLIGTIVRVKRKLIFLFYIPWLIITVMELILDMICTCVFMDDIYDTMTLDGWLNFVGASFAPNFEEPASIIRLCMDDLRTSLASIIMVILFSRYFIIWIINAVLFFRVLVIAIKAFLSRNELYCVVFECET